MLVTHVRSCGVVQEFQSAHGRRHGAVTGVQGWDCRSHETTERAWCCRFFFFSSRRRHTRFDCDWSSDVCSSDLVDDGKLPSSTLSLSQALSGSSSDPCVGKFLEFRIVRDPAQPDVSQVPATLIPNPDLSAIPVARTRTFKFGDGANQTTNDPVTSFRGPWGIGTDGGDKLDADFGRISAAPRFGTREIWNLVNDGGGWDHPIHIHFEEGQILKRNG